MSVDLLTSSIRPRDERTGHHDRSETAADFPRVSPYWTESIEGTGKILCLSEGVYLVEVVATSQASQAKTLVDISVPPCAQGVSNSIILSQLPRSTAGACATIVDVTSAGGCILIGAYGLASATAHDLDIVVRPVDRVSAVPAPAALRKVPLGIGLRLERLGLRWFASGRWAGSRGGQLRIQELALRTDPMIRVEVQAFAAGNLQTAWIPSGELAGFGDEIGLTGFAARPVGSDADAFVIFYSGTFAKAGVIGPFQDGQPCRSYIEDDLLVAVDVRIAEV